MANVVVGAAPTTNVVQVTQTGFESSNVVQSTETRGTITLNAATDVYSSAAPNDALLIWNANATRYELRAFTDLPIDGGTV